MEKRVQSADLMNLQTKLMMFRTAYLQAVATSWADEDYKNKIVSDAETAKKKCINILEKKAFTKFLPSGFNLDWHTSVTIIDTKMTKFSPEDKNANDGWIGSNDAFIIKIPKAPKSVEDRAQALMAYYRIYHSLLGAIDEGTSMISDPIAFDDVIDIFKPFHVNFEDYKNAKKANEKISLGDGGADNFYEFSAAFTTVLAKCWEDESYLQDLVENGMIGPVGAKNSVLKNDYADFHNPWSFVIKFELSDEAKWDKKKKKWKKLPCNQIFLSYPNKPETDVSKMADAISRYNNTGPSYPFTCN